MKNLAYNKTIGVAVLVVLILFSVFTLGGGKLAKQRDKVERMFYDGVQNDSLSIYNDLASRADGAYDLISIATKYLDANSAEIAALRKTADAVGDTQDIGKLAKLSDELTADASALEMRLRDERLSSGDDALFQRTLDEMNSRASTMSHDAYNSYAADFNDLRKGFPAHLIAVFSGVKALELFR